MTCYIDKQDIKHISWFWLLVAIITFITVFNIFHMKHLTSSQPFQLHVSLKSFHSSSWPTYCMPYCTLNFSLSGPFIAINISLSREVTCSEFLSLVLIRFCWLKPLLQSTVDTGATNSLSVASAPTGYKSLFLVATCRLQNDNRSDMDLIPPSRWWH